MCQLIAKIAAPISYVCPWLKTGDSSLLERVVKKKQVFKRGEVLYRMGQPVEHM
ncbi:hypothetical protein [Nitrosovibrio sp. Nv6]|uniref:hypothetical protein n=1 Tax=Nitrosovibrio sp. Nv6 TaxID=1855340 RepID=UPI0008C35BCA|nr:hypothetical protein [Nitrosovibrio sp. Nv6]SEO69398.1 hypothetical protein SAMN05216316_0819 [Nitrosovibrio sp. Nv6]